MNVNLTCVMLVLETESNPDIRKNDIKTIKLLVRRSDGALPRVIADTHDDIKQQMRNALRDAIGTEYFHLEQVYTLGDKKYMAMGEMDVIHLGIANKTHLNQVASDYALTTINMHDNTITVGNQEYKYRTIEKVGAWGIEYLFETNARDIQCDKMLTEILTAWKYLRSRLDNTDAIFKFMPDEFALEDVRQVYEIISGRRVDKSNFHKKIIKYCAEIPDKTTHRGHRPGKLYKFNAKLGDTWL